MGHTRFKRKKKRWATRKAQRGGDFNPAAPTKEEQQGIDSFHDFWPLSRGLFKTNKTPIWRLMKNSIRWLLINYSIASLNVTPTRSLVGVPPTATFQFTPYTTNKHGSLFYISDLTPSAIEQRGRDYIKIPEGALWAQPAGANPHDAFRDLFDKLFPGTDPNLRNESIIYIVCDSGAGLFGNYGRDSITAAVMPPAAGLGPLDTITKTSALAGAIAAYTKINNDHAISTLVENAVKSYKLINSATAIKANSAKCKIIGSLYIAPLIIMAKIRVDAAVAAAVAAGANQVEAAMAEAATAELVATEILGRINAALNIQALLTSPAEIAMYNRIMTSFIDDIFPPVDDVALVAELNTAYTDINKLEIILSVTQQIAAAILVETADTTIASQIVAVATAASTRAATPIGPFVKEIATPQTSADSAKANPIPSTIPGDVYPIMYEFVTRGQQAVHPHPFPNPPGYNLAADKLFYSDANLYTHGRYEIRYEKDEWSPITGLGFDYVIGDIQAAANLRYKVKFGITDGEGKTYNTGGPSAALLAACCLKSMLDVGEPAAGAVIPQVGTHDAYNKELNRLLGPINRTAIKDIMTPLLSTVGTGMFSNDRNIFHPYLHFEGNDPAGQFHELPPELWLDIKRAGDRDQVMAAYELSQQTNLDGSPKYPYLVFVTGDELCGTIAVKKGLATIYQSTDVNQVPTIRYWPKGIVYRPAVGSPDPFPATLAALHQPYQMYTPANLPANLPGPRPEQYSIQSWGGNRMKGGDYQTMNMHDKIEDGYGKEYSRQQISEIVFRTPTNYICIDNTPGNIEKLLNMDFGTVDMGMILFACKILGTGQIRCTPEMLVALLMSHHINVGLAQPLAEAAAINARLSEITARKIEAQTRLSQSIITNAAPDATAATKEHAKGNADAAKEAVTAFINQSAIDILNGISPSDNVQARIQENLQAATQLYNTPNIQPWVYDMIAIFSFSAVPNQKETLYRVVQDLLGDNLVRFKAQYMAQRFAVTLAKATWRHSPLAAAAAPPAMEGGQQKLNYDFIIKYGIEPIYNDINDKFAGGKLPELNSELESKIKSELESKIKSESESDTESEAKSDTELNPILGYITETMIKYLNMPNLASIVSSFNIFCSMMSYNETMSSIQSAASSAASSASSSASSSAASSASNDDEKTEFVSTDKPTNISRKRIPEFKPDRKEEEMRRSFEGLPNTISKNAAAAAAAGGKHRTRRKHSKQKKRETQKKRPVFNAAYRVAKKSNKKSRKNLI